jgi:uncharacterized membrane protein YhhN
MDDMRPTPVLRWAGFVPFAVASIIHISALTAHAAGSAAVTKLLLMPLLAAAVIWAGWGDGWRRPRSLLLAALALSWLGDEVAVFFPLLPELPGMLLFFGLAHLVYIWLFLRHLVQRPARGWALLYAAWWIAMLVVLFPRLGTLSIAVAAYGLVLGAAATSAARGNSITAIGGLLFLTSDSILAFRLFTPDAMPDWTSPLVMLTYCVGQGLLAAGVLVATGPRPGARVAIGRRHRG